MKTIIPFFLFAAACLLMTSAYSQGVTIGSNNPPAPSAVLDIQSTTGGFLLPKLTTTQRNAIISPAEALQIYNTTTKCVEIHFLNSGWRQLLCDCVSLPNAGFSTPGNIVAGAQANFSANTPGLTYAWTFQGGNPGTSNVQSPTVTFANAGTYTVTLVVTNNAGCSNTSSASVTVSAAPPAFTSCQAILNANPGSGSGNYQIDPDGNGGVAPFTVYCDMNSQGGGWTQIGTIQRSTSSNWGTWGSSYWTNTATINYPGGENGDNDYKNPGWNYVPFTQMLVVQTNGGSYYVVANGGIGQPMSYMYSTYMISPSAITGCGFQMNTITSNGSWNRIGLAGCSDNSNENTLFSLDGGNAGGYYHNRPGDCMSQAEWGSWGNCVIDQNFGGAKIFVK